MKEVSERRVVLVIEVTKEPGEELVIESRADYTVTADGLTESRSQPVVLAPAPIRNLAKQALEQIRSAEED
ncbi:hypothetical protein LCGC14_1698670 [marine sediment metagenome]|uniref:Uncharacterized protein n=1 Tax=marine sediment metagenome TaxID=412755 RepID=A0A0F9HID7_9ZZZZ